MSDWRQTAQEAFWFPLVLAAEGLRKELLSWDVIAGRLGCSPSALRYWRGCYWRAFEAAHAPDGNLTRFLALCGAGPALPEGPAPDNAQARRT